MSAAEKNRARKISGKTSTMRNPYCFVGSGLPNVYLVGVDYELDRETGEQRADIPRLPDLLTSIAVALLGKEAPLTSDEVRFLRKRVGKSSKDFAQLVGLTSEQYSRIETGAVSLTASNDKLFRLMVIAMSVMGALEKPALMERVATQTWSTGLGPERRIIARVDAEREWVVETKAA